MGLRVVVGVVSQRYSEISGSDMIREEAFGVALSYWRRMVSGSSEFALLTTSRNMILFTTTTRIYSRRGSI